jgi:hypothetical protein
MEYRRAFMTHFATHQNKDVTGRDITFEGGEGGAKAMV